MDNSSVVFYLDLTNYLIPYVIDFDNDDFKHEIFVMIPGENDYFKIFKVNQNQNNCIYSFVLIYQKNKII